MIEARDIEWIFEFFLFEIPIFTPKQQILTMAGDKIPTVQSLEKPEKLEDILRQDRGEDCLPCKVVGQFLYSLNLRMN